MKRPRHIDGKVVKSRRPELCVISETPTFPVRYGRDNVSTAKELIVKLREPYLFRKEPCDGCGRDVPVSGGFCRECREKDPYPHLSRMQVTEDA